MQFVWIYKSTQVFASYELWRYHVMIYSSNIPHHLLNLLWLLVFLISVRVSVLHKVKWSCTAFFFMSTNRSRLRRVLKSFLINKLIITYILRVLISLLRILFLIYNFVGFIIETELIKTESEFLKPNPNRRLRFWILKTEDIWLRFRFYLGTEPNRASSSFSPILRERGGCV